MHGVGLILTKKGEFNQSEIDFVSHVTYEQFFLSVLYCVFKRVAVAKYCHFNVNVSMV